MPEPVEGTVEGVVSAGSTTGEIFVPVPEPVEGTVECVVSTGSTTGEIVFPVHEPVEGTSCDQKPATMALIFFFR